MPLSPHVYQYKFIVDGKWVVDPSSPLADDGFGGKNNTIEVKPYEAEDEEDSEEEEYFIFVHKHDPKVRSLKSKKITYQYPAKWVAIRGSWDNWTDDIMLKKVKNNYSGLLEFYVNLKIEPGEYQFKFIVDGVWITGTSFPVIKNADGVENNQLSVPFFSNLTEHKPLIL